MCPDYSGYEAEKRLWIALNPTATPQEYEDAMQVIARKYGV